MAAVKSVLDELSETIADAKARREQELARAKAPAPPKETTTIGFGTAPAAPSSSVMMLQPKKKKAKLTPGRAAGAALGGERVGRVGVVGRVELRASGFRSVVGFPLTPRGRRCGAAAERLRRVLESYLRADARHPSRAARSVPRLSSVVTASRRSSSVAGRVLVGACP